MDDGNAVGPSDIMFPAIKTFANNVEQNCLLVWEKTISEVFSYNGLLPNNAKAGLTRAGAYVNGVFEPEFLCYGIKVGANRFVEHMLEYKLSEIAKSAKKSCDVLDEERQSLWAILRLSFSQQLDYWLQLCYPSNVKAAAEKTDDILWKVLETTALTSIPRNVTKIMIPGIQTLTYQAWLIRQPIHLIGFGLRSQIDLIPAAFIGAV